MPYLTQGPTVLVPSLYQQARAGVLSIPEFPIPRTLMLRFKPLATAIAIAALAASTASAQQRERAMAPPQGGPPPGGPMGRAVVGPSGMDAASMLLAQTAALKLSDQQVTRLAAIARRTGERRTAMMASLDSLRATRLRAANGAAATPGAAFTASQ